MLIGVSFLRFQADLTCALGCVLTPASSSSRLAWFPVQWVSNVGDVTVTCGKLAPRPR